MKLDKILKKIEKIDSDSFITNPREVSLNIALIDIDDKVHIIFEKRSAYVNQPNDSSFPGGHLEENESHVDCMIRETCEELGIQKDNIEVIKKFGKVLTYSNLYAVIFITRIIGIDIGDMKPDECEVSEIFAVDIDDLLKMTPERYESIIFSKKSDDFPYQLISGGKNYKFVKGKEDTYFYKINGHIIWGFTAGILTKFLEMIRDE